MIESERESRYETVAANPKYDTEAAEQEHAKALKIVNRHLAGQTANLAEAESYLHKALVADVTYGPAHNTLGTIYMRQRKLYIAAWEFDYAAKLMPDRYEPLYNLGQVYEASGKIDSALVYYEQALGLAPRNPCILGNLARAQLKSGKPFDEVRPLLEEIVFLDRRPDWIAWARDELGRQPVQTASIMKREPAHDALPESAPQLLPALPPVPAIEDSPHLSPPLPPGPERGRSPAQEEGSLPDMTSAGDQNQDGEKMVENAANSEPAGLSSASDAAQEYALPTEDDEGGPRAYSDWAPLFTE